MGLIVCDECKCIENTNLTGVINRDNLKEGYPNLSFMAMRGFNEAKIGDERGEIRMLCSECNTGTWHGEFEKRQATDIELALSELNSEREITLHPLYRKSLDGEVTVEEIKALNKELSDIVTLDPYVHEVAFKRAICDNFTDIQEFAEASEETTRRAHARTVGKTVYGSYGNGGHARLINELHKKDPGLDEYYYRSEPPYKREEPKISRNGKCPCGSGVKYKKCCL